MATEEGFRGKGIGSRLLEAVEEYVGRSGKTKLMWCNGRVGAVAFYRRHGWQVVSEEFEIPTAGRHVKMMKNG
jgi:GNAT superfamily N-acetyltransferase